MKFSTSIPPLFFSALVVLSSAYSTAAPYDLPGEKIWESQTQTLIERQEEGAWIVEAFSEAATTLPSKTGRWYFQKATDSAAFIERYLNRRPQLQLRENFSEVAPLFRTEMASEVIWKAENVWDELWEQKYADWVQSSVSKTFFSDNKVATDCADVAIATRWIFARINKLPAGQNLASGKAFFTNESMRPEWARFATHADWTKDRRFRAALDYVLNLTYTHSLYRDSYPVEIKPGAFKAGTHHLHLSGASGHTLLVREVNETSNARLPVYIIASTMPRAVRELSEYSFFYTEQPKETDGGFMKIRWPLKDSAGRWTLKSRETMPYFSKEQYDPAFMNGNTTFALAIYKHINPQFDPLLRVRESFDSLDSLVKERAAAVEEGLKFCSTHDCSPGSDNYENWSTPSRDKRILAFLEDVAKYVSQLQVVVPEIVQEWEAFLKKPILTLNNVSYKVSLLYFVWKSELYSSDPRRSLVERWNFDPKTFAKTVLMQANEIYHEREKIVAANSCYGDGSCTADSEAFSKYQTYDLDSGLRKRAVAIDGYCLNVEPDQCEEAKKGTSEKLNLGDAKSLDELKEISLWLNSDPRHGKGVREGALRSQLPHVNLDSSIEDLIESDSHHVFVRTKKATIFLKPDMTTAWEELYMSPLKSHFNPKTSSVVWFSDQGLFARNSLGQKATLPTVYGEAMSVRWLGPNFFVIKTNQDNAKASLFKYDLAETITFIKDIEYFDIGYFNEHSTAHEQKWFSYTEANSKGEPQLYYFSTTGDVFAPQYLAVQDPDSDINKASKIVSVLGDKAVLYYALKNQELYRMAKVDLKTGQRLQYFDFTDGMVYFRSDSQFVVQKITDAMGSSELIQFDAQLNPQTVSTGYGFSGFDTSGDYFAVFGSSLGAYRVDGTGFEAYKYAQAGEMVISAFRGLVVSFSGEGNGKIRNFSTGQELPVSLTVASSWWNGWPKLAVAPVKSKPWYNFVDLEGAATYLPFFTFHTDTLMGLWVERRQGNLVAINAEVGQQALIVRLK